MYCILGRRRTLNFQREKFGVYLLERVDTADGRAVFRRRGAQVRLFYYVSPRTGWRGWLAGPREGEGRGGLLLETESVCVERELAARWRFFDGQDFVEDPTLTATCFTEEDEDRHRDYDTPGGTIGRTNAIRSHVTMSMFLCYI